jgi:hypothetical protein
MGEKQRGVSPGLSSATIPSKRLFIYIVSTASGGYNIHCGEEGYGTRISQPYSQ